MYSLNILCVHCTFKYQLLYSVVWADIHPSAAAFSRKVSHSIQFKVDWSSDLVTVWSSLSSYYCINTKPNLQRLYKELCVSDALVWKQLVSLIIFLNQI